jgi:chloride channel protein, CIC family
VKRTERGGTTREQTPLRRLLLLSGLATALGLAGGATAYVLIKLIALLTNLALFHRYAWQLPSLRHLHGGLNLVLVAAAGGLIVSLLARRDPEIRGHGIPEAMEAVLTNESRIKPVTALLKPLSAAIAIGTGGPFGAEGPIIVTGGALGSLVGQILPVSPSERKILLACGAAAGMAATFGTPLASVILAIELLLFEFSARAFIPLVVSTALAAGVHSALFGTGPLFAVPAHEYAGLTKLPLYGLLGLLCGLLAVLINKGLFLTEKIYRRLPWGEFWHPLIGAVGFALIGLVAPRALGVGYDEISDVLLGHLALTALITLALAKLVAWWIALGSGTSGGTLAPLLLISGSFGSIFGIGVNAVWPGAHVSPGAFALVAMAAAFGASIRATFTAIVFLFELTRDYQIILPLMIASVLAEIVASATLRESLMTEKLSRRGLHVLSDYEADVLASTYVRDVMTTGVETVPAGATVGQARRILEAEDHEVAPVLDGGGRCVAIVARRDLIDPGLVDTQALLDVADTRVVAVLPEDSALVALRQMLENDVTHLPVLEDGRLVGICTRTDILQARLRQFEYERLQPGIQLGSVPASWRAVIGRLPARIIRRRARYK